MAKNTGNLIRLGFFVTIGAILFLAGVYFIGNKQNLFGSTFRVSSYFRNVNGLQPGNNVRYAGISVGTIENILIVNDSTLRVDMRLEEGVRQHIKRDAIASIGSDGLVGNMLVNISPGTGGEPPVEDGALIASYSRIEAEDILNTLGKTNENITLISRNLLSITEKMDRGDGAISTLLQDPMLAENLRQSVENLQRTSRQLLLTGNKMNGLISRIEQGEGLIGQLLTDSTFLTEITGSVRHVDTTLTSEMESLFSELKRSNEEITNFGKELNSLIETTRSGEGPVGALLNDEAMEEDIRRTLENINEGTARFNENMEAMKHNFLFRGYFKRKAREARKAAKKAAKEEKKKNK